MHYEKFEKEIEALKAQHKLDDLDISILSFIAMEKADKPNAKTDTIIKKIKKHIDNPKWLEEYEKNIAKILQEVAFNGQTTILFHGINPQKKKIMVELIDDINKNGKITKKDKLKQLAKMTHEEIKNAVSKIESHSHREHLIKRLSQHL